jgi:hypothetical protein
MQRQSIIERAIIGVVVTGLALVVVLGSFVVLRGVQRLPEAASQATTAEALQPSPQPPTAIPESPRATTASATAEALASAPAAAVAAAPNVRVSRDEYTAHSEVTLAQNPRDPQNLIGASKMFTDNENYIFRIGVYVSFDGGRTWLDQGQLSGLERYQVTSDPTVVFDSAGTAYVEVLAARDPNGRSALYLYRSSDGGRTWSDPLLVNDDASGFNDKEWLAADTTGDRYDGQLYSTWVQIVEDRYRIMFARSLDGGATWSSAQELAGDARVTRQGPIVSVDGAGNVFVHWGNLTTSQFELAVSTDGGATFSSIRRGLRFQNLEPLNGNLRRGFVLAGFAADPRTPNTVYVVWDDGRGGDGDVLFSVSADGGASWRAPVVVNGDRSNDQFQPWLAIGPNSEIYLQWFDRRDDPENLLVHTYAARSLDGGRTWSELRVTDVASDPTVGLPMAGDVGFYGDYQGLIADGAGAQLFWNETRDGSQEVYTARVTPDRWGPAYQVQPAGPPRKSTPATTEEEEGGE